MRFRVQGSAERGPGLRFPGQGFCALFGDVLPSAEIARTPVGIPIIFLLYSWGSLFGVPSKVPLELVRTEEWMTLSPAP